MIKFKNKRQINMEFGVGEQLDFVSSKKKLSIKVAESKLSNLRELAGRMKPYQGILSRGNMGIY